MGQNLESLFLHLAHLIRSINDPEHPLTLEELNVVEQVRIQVSHRQHQSVGACSDSFKRFRYTLEAGVHHPQTAKRLFFHFMAVIKTEAHKS